MLVFIHDNFKLDLTYLNVTFTEQNPWMKDDFSTEFSIPFDLYLDTELSKKSGFEAHFNANQNKTIFDGFLDKDGELSKALLKFIGIKGKKITAVINAGIDSFPSFEKKLSELLLETKVVDDIVVDAQDVITKTYPDTNYNFQMVHVDKYDPTTPDFNGFEKIINNYDDGAFLTNELTVDNVDLIRNIMQPIPYLMHILKTGVSDSGKTLAGDILTDYELNRTLVFRDGQYFKQTVKEEIPAVYQVNEWTALAYQNNGYQYVNFTKEIEILKKGDYTLFGDIESVLYTWHPLVDNNRKRRSSVVISVQKVHLGVAAEIWGLNLGRQGDGTRQLSKSVVTYSLDVPVSFEVGDILRIIKTEPQRDQVPSETPDNPEAISLRLIPNRYRNPDGTPILNIINRNEINLTNVVPDMTFGQLITIIKNLKNYDFIPDGDLVYMNKIQKKLNRALAKNLTDSEIEEPEWEFHEDREFELAFVDGKTNETYKYDSILITGTGTTVNNYKAKTTVNTINIDALPLPVLTRNGVTTSYNFEDQPEKLRLIFMKAYEEGNKPVGFWNEKFTIPQLYENDYKDWIDFRIKSMAGTWDFVVSVEKFREITIQTLIYAYQNYHVFSEIEKERLNSMYWRITAKTESLL
ncbi:MAG: hypothetical protein H7Y10_12355 [Flavobacterium sp.]|nr:hypothetical protein [Flavobacterium sp.]